MHLDHRALHLGGRRSQAYCQITSARGPSNSPPPPCRQQPVAAAKHQQANGANAPTKSLDAEIFSLALPTLATLATDPLASLVSTAWIGRLGAIELAGAGVAISVFNTFTKVLAYMVLCHPAAAPEVCVLFCPGIQYAFTGCLHVLSSSSDGGKSRTRQAERNNAYSFQ